MSVVGSISNLFQRGSLSGADLRPTPTIKTGGASESGLVEKTGSATTTSFDSVLTKFVGEVDGKLKTAGAEQQKVLSGESTNLHQAMIAMQEGSVAFSLMVEVRNKLVEGYQELMRMQI